MLLPSLIESNAELTKPGFNKSSVTFQIQVVSKVRGPSEYLELVCKMYEPFHARPSPFPSVHQADPAQIHTFSTGQAYASSNTVHSCIVAFANQTELVGKQMVSKRGREENRRSGTKGVGGEEGNRKRVR